MPIPAPPYTPREPPKPPTALLSLSDAWKTRATPSAPPEKTSVKDSVNDTEKSEETSRGEAAQAALAES
jgi:hypothetical protein